MKSTLLNKVVFTVFGIVILFPSISFAQDQDEVSIRQRVQQYEDAYNSGDAKAVAEIYDLNGTHTYANGITDRGREEIEKGLSASFEGPMRGTQLQLTPEQFRFPKEDIVIENASFILTGMKMPDGSDFPPIHGLCMVVYQLKEGEWFVIAAQCMVPIMKGD